MRRIHPHKGAPWARSLSATSSTARANNWPSHRPFVPVNLHIYLPSHLSLRHFFLDSLCPNTFVIFPPLTSSGLFRPDFIPSHTSQCTQAGGEPRSIWEATVLTADMWTSFIFIHSEICMVCLPVFAFHPYTNTKEGTQSVFTSILYFIISFTHTHTRMLWPLINDSHLSGRGG